jgi:hypothetical protein
MQEDFTLLYEQVTMTPLKQSVISFKSKHCFVATSVFAISPLILSSGALAQSQQSGGLSLKVADHSTTRPSKVEPVLLAQATDATASETNPLPNAPNNNPIGTTSDAREPAPATNVPDTGTSDGEEVVQRGFKFGADVYYGVSNLPGAKRFRDGFWIGYGPAYPSVVYGRWETPNGSAAKVSLSVGELYNGSVSNLDQPVEAWYQRPVGKYTITAGKFYVPFAIQEWQYETKWGGMVSGKLGNADFSTSLNHNHTTDSLNYYGRIAKSFGDNVTLGFSAGGGKGFSFDSSHNKGIGIDASLKWRGFQLDSEYTALQRKSSADRFQFAHAKLSYTELGKFTPYIARHTWFDRAGELGNYNGSTAGVAYQITPGLSVEGAYARTYGQSVRWIQLHYTVER